jgi:integrase
MWCATLELPSVEPGKRRRKVIVRARKEDALRELRAARQEYEKIGDLPTASPTVAQWCDLWWTRHGMTRLKVSNRSGYRSRIEQYIKPSIGRVRLDKLSPEHVYRLHEYIVQTKGLSPTTAKGAHAVLSSILSDAVIEGRATRNVAQIARKPRDAHHEAAYLDNAQARDLLMSVRDHPDEAARWAVAILTGMRQAERLGLTRDAIDFDAGTITVSWQLRRLTFEHGCGKADSAWTCGRKRGGNCPERRLDIPADQEVRHIGGALYLIRPKTRAGWRVVPMVGLLADILQHYLEGRELGEAGLIFTRPDGSPLEQTDDSDAWRAALQRAGLPRVGGHSARHTCNTVLTELGVPVDVRRQILGHASNAINEAIYTHTSDTRVAEAMRALSAAMDYRQT